MRLVSGLEGTIFACSRKPQDTCSSLLNYRSPKSQPVVGGRSLLGRSPRAPQGAKIRGVCESNKQQASLSRRGPFSLSLSLSLGNETRCALIETSQSKRLFVSSACGDAFRGRRTKLHPPLHAGLGTNPLRKPRRVQILSLSLSLDFCANGASLSRGTCCVRTSDERQRKAQSCATRTRGRRARRFRQKKSARPFLLRLEQVEGAAGVSVAPPAATTSLGTAARQQSAPLSDTVARAVTLLLVEPFAASLATAAVPKAVYLGFQVGFWESVCID